MSVQAISWALDLSGAAANDRLVVIVMAHHTDDDGYAALSKSTLAGETRLSESTILRCQTSLVKRGEITRVAGDVGPAWWVEIPKNRRPKLYEMSGFLGSQYATAVHRRRGVSLGSHRGVTGVHDTPPDQELRDVKALDLKSSNTVVPISALPKSEPPWRSEGVDPKDWARNG